MTKLKPHVLTDKTDTKELPCTVCQRTCIVTRFATPAKVRCLDHKDLRSKPNQVREFDRSKEPHVLTDKDKTKEVPCRTCGRPCVVNVFASPEKVACNDHRKVTPVRTTVIERTEDGRFEQRTKLSILSEEDVAWSQWVLGIPFIDLVWTADERAAKEKLREQRVIAMGEISKLRTIRRVIETELYSKKEPTEKREAELNEQLSKLEGEIAPLEAAIADSRKEQDELARRVWLRSALDRGYRVEHTDDGYVFAGRLLKPLPFPPKWLPEHDLKAVV